MVDYRLDPKASTGGFELIYRQIIPPAPAYLGLNLFLKGTQLLPKNGGGKREKSREFLKLRNELRPSTDYNSALLNGKDLNGPDILTPRPFIVDLIDCINSKTDTNRTPRKGNKLRALMPTKRSTNLNSTATLAAKENGNSESPRSKWSSTLSRQYSTVAQIDTSRRKSMAKSTATSTTTAVEQPRRHVSCGPRLMTTTVAQLSPPLLPPPSNNPPSTPPTVIDEPLAKSDNEINNNNNENPELTCVGSKCCTENEYSTPNHSNSATNGSNSSRKPSLETPRIFPNNKPKLRPLNVVNNTNNNNNCSKSVTSKFLSANNRDYRKYVNHLKMSKLQPISNVNDSYCSHFFAVGLSLRAWRSKYNQMLKSQNDKVEFAQSYGPISSRKTKRLESK